MTDRFSRFGQSSILYILQWCAHQARAANSIDVLCGISDSSADAQGCEQAANRHRTA